MWIRVMPFCKSNKNLRGGRRGAHVRGYMLPNGIYVARDEMFDSQKRRGRSDDVCYMRRIYNDQQRRGSDMTHKTCARPRFWRTSNPKLITHARNGLMRSEMLRQRPFCWPLFTTMDYGCVTGGFPLSRQNCSSFIPFSQFSFLIENPELGEQIFEIQILLSLSPCVRDSLKL
jgi:hypothetical protein